MRDILICTVGTSLIGNLKRGAAGPAAALDAGNARRLAVELAGMNPGDRILGAEINSVDSIVRQGLLSAPGALHLLVSDTDDGRFTGETLKAYFRSPRQAHRFETAVYRVVEGLTDSDPGRFKNEGLRNLVRLIADVVRKNGPERVLINATGGYKAQISFAGLIGQALGVPVCYMFERFSEVIELPPQPVSFDLRFWLDNASVFYELDSGLITDSPDFPGDERFETLVEKIPENENYLVALSAAGQLFHESFRMRFQKDKTALLPPPCGLDPEDKKIVYEDKNANKHAGLKTHLERIMETPYVKRIFTHYYNPSLPRPNRFRKSAKGESSQVEGWYSFAGATTKFDITTTAATPEQQSACIVDLMERFC